MINEEINYEYCLKQSLAQVDRVLNQRIWGIEYSSYLLGQKKGLEEALEVYYENEENERQKA